MNTAQIIALAVAIAFVMRVGGAIIRAADNLGRIATLLGIITADNASLAALRDDILAGTPRSDDYTAGQG